MLKRNWALIALVYLAFAEILSLAPVPDLALCLIEPEHGQQATNHDDPKYCPAFHMGAALFIERTDRLLEAHDKSVIGAFTIVLAISTIGLWFATNRLWKAGDDQLRHARDTAERQLRAYLVVEPRTIENFGVGLATTGNFCIRNVGQTPPHDVIMATSVFVTPYPPTPMIVAPPVKELEASPNARKGYFADSIEVGKDSDRAFSRPEIDAVYAGRSRLYVGGRVYYKDIFDNQWHTDFLYAYYGPQTQGMFPFQCETGNKAT
jgi:hypothetical protein